MRTSFLLAALLSVGAMALAQSQQPPAFRSRLELVQLDVSVLDKHRDPVRGLTQQDFTVLEDGKPRKIVAFSAFELEDTEALAVGWMRDVPPDVTTNELKESRLFVIVIDDALIPQEPASIRDTKKILGSIIDKLAPDDLTAVVFSGDNRRTQDFTNDKTKLRAAIERLNPGLAGYQFGSQSPPAGSESNPKNIRPPVDTDLYFYQSSVRTLQNLAEYLQSVPNKRKALFWVSPGVPMDIVSAVPKDAYRAPITGAQTIPALICLAGDPKMCADGDGVWAMKLPNPEMIDLMQRTQEIFYKAQRANVTIYPMDPTGLAGLENYVRQRVGPMNQGLARHKVTTQQDYLASAAANTGGRTVMNTNDWEPGIRDVFAENSSYYLIAFEPANMEPDGKLHKIKVEVNRPDVDVRTRTGYWAPRPEQPNKRADGNPAVSPESVELAKAISGLVPDASLPMKVALAPFVVPGQRLSTVTVVLGVRQPIPPEAAKSRLTEVTELLTSAFTPEGDARGAQRHTARVVLRAGSDGEAAYEVLGRIELPPGRYRLRLAAHNATSRKSGSVFADVVVPDYSNLPVSASPIILGATPGRASAPREILSPILPLVPTAERQFTKSDRVTALLRLYQNGQKTIERTAVTINLRNATDSIVATESRTVGAEQFAAVGEPLIAQNATISTRPPPPTMARPTNTPLPSPSADAFANLSLRFADVRYEVPVSRLTPGHYLLTIVASVGSTEIRRDLRIGIK